MENGELGRRSRNAIGFALLGAVSLLVFLGLLAPAAADARHVTTLNAVQLIAPPAVAKNQVRIAVVLNRRAQRRLGVQSPVVLFVIRRSMMVRVPRPNGKGRVPVEVEKIRSGDTIRTRVETKRRHKGKRRAGAAQVRANPANRSTFRVRWMRVMERQSQFSVDELTGFVFLLAQQLATLSSRVDSLTASTIAGFVSQQQQIDALKAELADLKASLATLKTALEEIEARLAGLEGDVEALMTQVQTLFTQVGALETKVAALETGLAALENRLDALEATVDVLEGLIDDLRTDLTALAGRVENLEADVGEILTMLGEALGDITALQGAVDDLQTDVGNLQTDVGNLQDDLGDLQTDVGDLQTTVGGLCTAVNDLVFPAPPVC